MTAEGEALGFGKIGWNALTRRDGGARGRGALAAHRRRRQTSFDAPAIVHAGPWQGFELMVVRPAITDGGGLRRGSADGAPPARSPRIGGLEHSALAALALVAIGCPSGSKQSNTPAWRRRSLRSRSGTARPNSTFGGCHGDWTPWNMGRRNGRLIVWDWERFHTGVPVGIDLAHFAFMVALRQRNQSPDEAQAHVLESLPARLEQLDVSGSLAPLVLRLHHVEMALRFAEARAQGVTTRHDLFAERLAVLVTE